MGVGSSAESEALKGRPHGVLTDAPYLGMNRHTQEVVRGLIDNLLPEIEIRIESTVRRVFEDRLVSVTEAARMLGCSPNALRKKIHRGNVRVTRVGRAVRIRVSDLSGPR